MIFLHTGLPGHGKTLRTIWAVKRLAEKEGREVYYHGIKDLMLPWIQMDKAEDWNTVPTGSIIVIDECQSAFRPRANGSQVPKYVQDFETHRHKGYDIFLVTQHPMLIDGNIRRLVGQHFHCVRAFGFARSYVYEFQQIRDNVDKNKKDGIRHKWKYPKEVYSYYKSAEVHTVKAHVPTRVWAAILILPLLIACAFYGYHVFNRIMHPQGYLNHGQDQQTQTGFIKTSQDTSKPDWYAQQSPRVQGLPFTAPKYDDITKPTFAPRIAACVQIRGKCTCYTQQATKIDTQDSVCLQIVQNGFFQDFDDKPSQNQPQQSTAQPIASQTPLERGKGVVTPLQAPIPTYQPERSVSAAASPES